MPPPITVVPAAPQGPREATIAYPVHVRITAGSQLLFDDTLRVARYSGASFTHSRSEALTQTCPDVPYHGSSARQSLSVQLYLSGSAESASAVNVNVNWQRPIDGAGCLGDGSRSVSVVQTVPLDPGRTATVQGDAGLQVTLSRR
jgi:hypothetical protein